MKVWWLAIRPKTLTAAVVPIMAATALAYYRQFDMNVLAVGCALGAALLIQIATNLINDVIDHDKGADTAERVGPQRVTQSGLIHKKTVMTVALGLLLLATVLGLRLVMIGGWPIFIIGILSLFLAYGYTGGPFPLAYLGLGDLFVMIFFGWVAVGGVYYLVTLQYDWQAFVLGTQVGALGTVLIAINNMRDVYQDKIANKKTLAVRWGVTFVRYEILGLLLLTFLLQAYWLYQTKSLWVLLPYLLFPIATRLGLDILKTEPSGALNACLARAAKLQGGFGLLISLVFYLA